MDKAKNAVQDFMSRDGKHDTTLHETTAPAITNETVAKQHHENVTTAIDREVHQDHYHTSVQPVKDREVAPEQHHHRAAPVEHREHQHGDADKLKRGLEQEAAKFQNTRTEAPVKETHSKGPVVEGEHVHHHVHESIQPVINKETIVPHVTHTTVPIHEVHHNEAKHHAVSALPAVSMSEFKKQGGATSRGENIEVFEGHPHAPGQHLSGSGSSKLGNAGDGIECSCGKTPGTGDHCKVHPQSVGGHGTTRDGGLNQTSAIAGSGVPGTHHGSGHTGTGTDGLTSRDKPLPQPGTNTAGTGGAAATTALGHGTGSHNKTHGLGNTTDSSMGSSGGHRDADGIIRVPAESSHAGSGAHGGLGGSTHGSGVTGGTTDGGLHHQTEGGSAAGYPDDTTGKKPGMLDRIRDKLH